uniref:Retrotransposon protein n=1 Tax=Tanacetum cinerariifolium TaxID=118510 RepID=A0A6L2K3Z2_TANCI|nr:retrotransposon protein [Tanacetum cinerariifolium]
MIDENFTLWHRRLGHAYMRLIQSFVSKELVRNLHKRKFDQHFCDVYKIRKQAHASRKAKNIVSTTRCLELLHMDLFRPSAIRSYRGNRYTLVIVDDYSRTLQEISRAMLNEKSLPQKFWCNAVDTSTYILNQILIIAILGKTPYELLRDRKPTLDYFRVFRSKCFILNTKDYLIKFDPKSYEGIFLGYSQNSKAYIILNKHTRKVKESPNVTFDENPSPSKISPFVDDDLGEEEAIKVTKKKILENDIKNETLEIDKIVNIKESRNHPLENVIGTLNQRTLRSQAQNQSYSQNSKAYIILNKHTRKVKESLNVTFDETPPPSKTSPFVDDDLGEEEAIKVIEKKNLENDIEDEILEIEEIVNIKESRNHPLENVIGTLNQRTLRSQAQNQINFFCFLIRAILGKIPYELLKGYSQNSKAYIILNKHTWKVEESLNMTFDETPPPSKTSPFVDYDLVKEEAIKVTEKKNLKNDIEDKTLEIDKIVNIKESRNHPLENVIGTLNQRTLRSQAQNQSNFFCFISTIEPKNVNEALTDDSWIVAMQEESNQVIAIDV